MTPCLPTYSEYPIGTSPGSSIKKARAWVRELDFDGVSALAGCALELESAGEVAELLGPLADELLGQPGDAGAERVEGGAGVVAIGGQP